MSNWNFNLDSAPRGHSDTEKRPAGKDGFRYIIVYRYVPVILASKCGKVVKSRWLPPEGKSRPIGRWEGFNPTGDDPVAWMPWPEHPRPE